MHQVLPLDIRGVWLSDSQTPEDAQTVYIDESRIKIISKPINSEPKIRTLRVMSLRPVEGQRALRAHVNESTSITIQKSDQSLILDGVKYTQASE